jgi:uncharacterized membrane protein
VADKEIATDQKDPAKATKQSDKQAKADKAKADKAKKQKENDGIQLPVLVEFMVTFSAIFLVLVFFAIVGISLITGTTLLDFVARTSVSILVIGSLLVIITRQISFGMLKSSMTIDEEKSEQKQSDEQQKDEPKKVEMPIASEAK